MTNQKPDYTERMAGPEDEDRGKVLDALAGGSYWAFLIVDLDEESPDQLNLKLEMHDGMSVKGLRNVLRQTLAALPKG